MIRAVNFIAFLFFCFSHSVLLAEKSDWSGLYSGLSTAETAGKDTLYLNDVFYVTNSFDNPIDRRGTFSGIFLGYLIQKDSLVYGAEIMRSDGKLQMKNVPANYIEDIRDFKIRLGTTYKKALFSTSLGYYTAIAIPTCLATCGTAKFGGASLGFGLDYDFNQSFFIGGHYSYKVYDRHKFDSGPGWGFEGHFQSIELRAGYKF